MDNINNPPPPDRHILRLADRLRALDTERGKARGNFEKKAANAAGRAIVRTKAKIYNLLWR